MIAAAALATVALAQTAPVGIDYSAFAPPRVQILAGDSVSWHNSSTREHTVNGADFASGRIARFGGFTHPFPTGGQFRYVCTIHPTMSGEVEVEPLLLDPPAGSLLEGRRVELSGRAQAGVGVVDLQRDVGRGFADARRVPVAADGTFRASLPPGPSATYRAAADGGLVSPPVRILVLGQQVHAAAVAERGRVTVRVSTVPARPGGTVVLELFERERFGWWPEHRSRLDRRGRARLVLPLRRPVRARIVLTARDGATPLATSRPLRIAPRR